MSYHICDTLPNQPIIFTTTFIVFCLYTARLPPLSYPHTQGTQPGSNIIITGYHTFLRSN